MIHDCALTEHYVVVYDLPVTFDMGMVTDGVPRLARLAPGQQRAALGGNPMPEWIVDAVARGESVTDPAAPLPYSWDPEHVARIGLVPRDGDGSDVRWFEIDPCYVFHTLNAFETGAPGSPEVVLDVVRHPRMFATDYTGPHEGLASLVRFTLDLGSGKAREHRFDEHAQEFPRYDERLAGKPHRYGYTVGMVGAGFGDTVLKHDVVAGTTRAAGSVPVARPGSSASSPTRTPTGRTTACSWATSTTAPPTAATWCCWTRRPSRTSPRAPARPGAHRLPRQLGAVPRLRSPCPRSGAVAGFVPVPVRARVGAFSHDERTADPAREVPAGQRVEDPRHCLLRVRPRRAHALCPKGSIRPLSTRSSRARWQPACHVPCSSRNDTTASPMHPGSGGPPVACHEHRPRAAAERSGCSEGSNGYEGFICE